MRVLLDTHIFLWVANESPRLNAEARRCLEEADAVYISSATIWEIAIKTRIGKITDDPDKMIYAIGASGFEELSVSVHHAAAVAKLPLHHRDPFDRLLIAQAITEEMRLLTADPQLKAYSELVECV